MITVNTAAAMKSQSSYSNFEQEVNFHHDQDQYECVIRDHFQSFYSTQSYHVVKDLILDDENIYDVKSNQTQDNQNFSFNQEKSKQSESDSEDYFADHVNILASKIKICQFCVRDLMKKSFYLSPSTLISVRRL